MFWLIDHLPITAIFLMLLGPLMIVVGVPVTLARLRWGRRADIAWNIALFVVFVVAQCTGWYGLAGGLFPPGNLVGLTIYGFYFVVPYLVGVILFRSLGPFHTEIERLEVVAAESKEWEDPVWLQRQIEENRTAYERRTDALFRQWTRNKGRTFAWRAFWASIFFSKNYQVVQRLYQRSNEELIMSWEYLTGKERPKW